MPHNFAPSASGRDDPRDRRLRVIVSRVDRIGDVVLTLPLCGLLKERRGAHVTVLAQRYTRDLLAAAPDVDEVIAWDPAEDAAAGRARLAAARADAILHVFPRAAIARAAWGAGVRRRIGTTRRAYHWLFCNELVALERRSSDRHEAQLNVQLGRPLLGADVAALGAAALGVAELAPYARLRPRVALPGDVASLVAGDRFTLVLHPRSLGSAQEWPLACYAALADALPPERFRVLITGTAADGEGMRAWIAERPAHVHDLTGRLSLAELITLLARVDGVVAASTGPLHIAAVLGTRALGLYPAARPMHPGRWAPLGARAEVLTAPHTEPGAEVEGVRAIPVGAVRARVAAWAGER